MSDAGLKRGLDVGVMPEQGAGPGAMQGERRRPTHAALLFVVVICRLIPRRGDAVPYRV